MRSRNKHNTPCLLVMESSIAEDPAQEEQRKRRHCSLGQNSHHVEVFGVHTQIAVSIQQRDAKRGHDATTIRAHK